MQQAAQHAASSTAQHAAHSRASLSPLTPTPCCCRRTQLQQRSRATPTAVEALNTAPSRAAQQPQQSLPPPQSGLLGFTPTMPPTIAAKLGCGTGFPLSASQQPSANPTPQASPFGTTGPSTPLEKLVGVGGGNARAPAAAAPSAAEQAGAGGGSSGGGGGGSCGGWCFGGVRISSTPQAAAAPAPGMAPVREERR